MGPRNQSSASEARRNPRATLRPRTTTPYRRLFPAVTIVLVLAGLGTLVLRPAAASAVTVGQIDTFGDGTLQGWQMGAAFATDNFMAIPTDGGPAGIGDRYLEVVSDSTQATAGSRMTFFNWAQWTGDYLGAGITAITIDIKNFSSSEALHLRLAINGGVGVLNGANFVGGLFATTASVTLDSGRGWTHAVFSLRPNDLTPVQGRTNVTGNDVMAALGNVLELRIVNSATPDWNGLKVDATLGVDNIHAVPEPAAVWLIASALAGIATIHRRRCTRNPRD